MGSPEGLSAKPGADLAIQYAHTKRQITLRLTVPPSARAFLTLPLCFVSTPWTAAGSRPLSEPIRSTDTAEITDWSAEMTFWQL